jgi:hypothetical protein
MVGGQNLLAGRHAAFSLVLRTGFAHEAKGDDPTSDLSDLRASTASAVETRSNLSAGSQEAGRSG